MTSPFAHPSISPHVVTACVNGPRVSLEDDGRRAPPTEPVVFIVHSDAASRAALEQLFASVGLRVVLFACPTEFVATTLPDVPSCIVLDVRLPGASGLDLQQRLARRGEDRPFVFVTRYGDVSVAVRAMKAGALDFLAEPWRDQDVLDAVTAAIELDRRRRGAQREKSEMEQRFSALTRRERQVMSHVVSGLMNKQIAGELGLAEITVKGHRRKLMTKLGARSVADLVKMSFGLGPDSLAGDQRADAAGSPPDRSGAPGSRDRLNRTPFQTARRSGSAPSDQAAAARL